MEEDSFKKPEEDTGSGDREIRAHSEESKGSFLKPEEPKDDPLEHSKPKENEVRIDNSPDSKIKNPWKIAALALGIVAVVLLFYTFSGKNITGNVIGGEDAGEKLVDFAESQGMNLEIVSIGDEGSFYNVGFLVNGKESEAYLTKDGKYLVQGPVPISGAPSTQTPDQNQQPPQEYSEEDLEKIKEFSQCLFDNGVKAYGAGWCGYCKKLKEAFGGEEQVAPFYFECQNEDRTPTEHSELCEQEQITGFPTIKINGEPYRGARTIEGLADAVEECDTPDFSKE